MTVYNHRRDFDLDFLVQHVNYVHDTSSMHQYIKYSTFKKKYPVMKMNHKISFKYLLTYYICLGQYFNNYPITDKNRKKYPLPPLLFSVDQLKKNEKKNVRDKTAFNIY